MKAKSISGRLIGLWVLFLALPAWLNAQFQYTVNGGAVTITKFTGQIAWLTVPNSLDGYPVVSIGDAAFDSNAYLMGVEIPFSVTNIGYAAFISCRNLVSVTLYNGPIRIGDLAFNNCPHLTSIAIPPSVASIGNSAFGFCGSLAAITVDPLNSSFASVDGVLFNKSLTSLVQYPGGKPGSYAISNGVTSIRFEAFDGCTNLTSVVIPNSVTNIAIAAFMNCYNLAHVTLPANLTTIPGYLFNYCVSLASLIIPAGVTNIGDYSFNSCSALSGIYFKGTPPVVSPTAFEQATNATIYYLPGAANWGPTLGGRPTALWKPQIANDGDVGVRTNHFGFNISWAGGRVVVVESSTNLNGPVWQSLQTNTLPADVFYFSDPSPANFSRRFYRLRAP